MVTCGDGAALHGAEAHGVRDEPAGDVAAGEGELKLVGSLVDMRDLQGSGAGRGEPGCTQRWQAGGRRTRACHEGR